MCTPRAWPRPGAAVHSHGAAARRMPPALACSPRGSAATMCLTCRAVLGASVATIAICPVQGCLSAAAPTPLLSAPRAQGRILGEGWGRECREEVGSDLAELRICAPVTRVNRASLASFVCCPSFVTQRRHFPQRLWEVLSVPAARAAAGVTESWACAVLTVLAVPATPERVVPKQGPPRRPGAGGPFPHCAVPCGALRFPAPPPVPPRPRACPPAMPSSGH